MFKLIGMAEEPEIKLDHRKSESSRKKDIYFCFIDYVKALDCVDHNKLWKILKEMGILKENAQTTTPPDLPLEKSVCRSGSNS